MTDTSKILEISSQIDENHNLCRELVEKLMGVAASGQAEEIDAELARVRKCHMDQAKEKALKGDWLGTLEHMAAVVGVYQIQKIALEITLEKAGK